MPEAAGKLPAIPASNPSQSAPDQAPPRAPRPPSQAPAGPAAGYVKALLFAGLGAAFGFVSGWGLWNEIHFHSVEFAVLILLLGLLGYVICDPGQKFFEGLGERKVSGHAHLESSPEQRTAVGFGFSALGVLLAVALDQSVHSGVVDDLGNLADELKPKTLGPLGATVPDASGQPQDLSTLGALAQHLHNWGRIEIALVAVGIIAAALIITHFWVRGVRRPIPWAAYLGAGAGLVFGGITVLLARQWLASRDLLPSGPAGLVVWLGFALALLWFCVPGFAGGLALHKSRDQRRGPHELVKYLFFSSAIYMLLFLGAAWIIQGRFKEYEGTINSLIWLPISILLFQNLGWALVFVLWPNLGSGHLWNVASTHPEPPASSTSGVVVMPIRNSESPASGAPAASKFDQRPQDLLLKPKGDRMWATAGLLIALLLAIPAYLFGTLRSDRDIAGNIESRLQQDSGLNDKSLQVHSDGRIVTLTGRVDSDAEHSKAVQQASAVRGVKQVIDQIQIVPPALALPPAASAATSGTTGTSTSSAPSQPAINANISIQKSSSSGAAATHKSAKGSQPHKLLGILPVGKNNPQQNSAVKTPAQNSAGQNSAGQNSATQQADQPKHGLFGKLFKKDKKDKNKKQNGQ